jgi:hypothetical protein
MDELNGHMEIFDLFIKGATIMPHGQKIYTSRASLCALGCYLQQERVLDDLKILPVPQKKFSTPRGKNSSKRLC